MQVTMLIHYMKFIPEVNVSMVLKLISRLAIELFSVQCNYKVKEA